MTAKGLMTAFENIQAAESRIRDADMAEEMVELTKNQVLVQTGTSMLAQANVQSQSVLRLIGT
jgi:flagellin